MTPFDYIRATDTDSALRSLSATPGARLLGGGTNLLDLMKQGVEQPPALIDVTRLRDLARITPTRGGYDVGALVRNSDLAAAPAILQHYPLLSQAILAGASAQLRNMATTGGNLMQRTRCYYFYDPALPACNKRVPGSGCGAIAGFNRLHAVLGQTDDGAEGAHTCIATNPSDMSVALAALRAEVHMTGPTGNRMLPVRDFHRLPGTTPQRDTHLLPDELITAVHLPATTASVARGSYYLKARDRQSYAFALVSVAAGLQLEGDRVQSVALALGGVAHKPWTSGAAEEILLGSAATEETFQHAAEAALQGAQGYRYNAFKTELAKRCIVRALTLAAERARSAAADVEA